jgi:uncharacterized protein (DUF58 family)
LCALVGALLALSLAAAFSVPLRRATLVLDLLLAAVVAVDFLRTPRPSRLALSRRAPARAGLSQDFVRTIRIAGVEPRARGLALDVREEFPVTFAVREPVVAGDPTGGPETCVLGENPVDLARVYRASRRGLHSLLDLRLRLRSPWGLVQRQSRMRGSTTIEVDPPMLGMRRTLRLAASERWRDLGVRVLRRRGGLVEFESLRDYVHGDDARLVDWKAFAKRGRPIVREFQEERGQELVLCFDCGRRMGVAEGEGGARGWTKLDHALDAGLQIAAVALQRGDRVGCLAFDGRVRAWIPPARSARQLERLHEAVFALQASELDSDLERALRELAVLHRRRALVLILSDVADPLSIDAQRRALAAGSKRHQILFAGLDDPSLRAAAEGNLPVETVVRAAAFALQEERRAGLRRLHGAGAQVLDTLPAEAAAPLLAAWLAARRGS